MALLDTLVTAALATRVKVWHDEVTLVAALLATLVIALLALSWPRASLAGVASVRALAVFARACERARSRDSVGRCLRGWQVRVQAACASCQQG